MDPKATHHSTPTATPTPTPTPPATPTRLSIKAATRGFSLMELMLVLVIIGTLMAVAAYNLVGTGQAAKVRATKLTLQNVKSVIETYMMENNSTPPDLQTLVGTKRLKVESTKDAWDTPFVYNPIGSIAGRDFELFSKGEDKQTGTPDDLDANAASATTTGN